MDWSEALKAKLLAEGEAEQRLKDFLLSHIGPFVASTDAKAWRKRARTLRQCALREIYLKNFPTKLVRAKPRIVWGEVLRPHKQYVIRKLRYEAYPDYWIPSLLYEPVKRAKRIPVMLNPNGHHAGGKAVTYKQARCANLALRGVASLSTEFIGMSELMADRVHDNLSFIDATGLAGVGIFYLAMSKGLNVLLARPYADRTRVGCTGLSGGGWQTIVLSALDERITLSVPVAGYTSVQARVGCDNDIGDCEQVPTDLTSVLDYTHMTAMLAPRPTLLIYNETDDCCFRTERVKPIVYDAVMPTFRALGAESNFEFYSNTEPGTHNYDADNRSQLYRFLNKHWGLASPDHDIHTDDEILSEPKLNVGVPPEQTTLMDIARERAKALINRLRTPRTSAARAKLRRELREVIRLPQYDAPDRVEVYSEGVSSRVLEIGPWRIPLSVNIQKTSGNDPELWFLENGRSGLPKEPTERNRFVADVLTGGENRCNMRRVQLLNTCGQRPLGVIVAQMIACAEHVAAHCGGQKLHLLSSGWCISFAATLAAALRPELFQSITPYSNFTSIYYPMAWGEKYEAVQSLLCFGILEVADVPQIRALLEGVQLRQPGRCVKDERIA